MVSMSYLKMADLLCDDYDVQLRFWCDDFKRILEEQNVHVHVSYVVISTQSRQIYWYY
jgi:hypothetical protein